MHASIVTKSKTLPQQFHSSTTLRPRLSRFPTTTTRLPFTNTPYASASAASADAEAPNLPTSTEERPNVSLRLAWDVLRPDLHILILTTVALIFSISVTLLFPLTIGDLFDVVKQYSQTTTITTTMNKDMYQGMQAALAVAASPPPAFRAVLLRLCFCLAFSATGNALVTYLASFLAERYGMRMRRRLMSELLLKRDQLFFDKSTKGDLVARLTTDVQTLQACIADFLGQRGFRSLFEVLGAMAVIATKNPLLAVISFAITPALGRLLRAVVVRASALSYDRQMAAASAADFASERLTHVTTVQVFAQEEKESKVYTEKIDKVVDIAKKLAFFQGMVEGGGRLAVNCGTLSLLFFGGILVLQGRISVGTLLSFNVFNLFISVGLSSIAASLSELGKAIGALQRISALSVVDDENGSSSSSSLVEAKSEGSSNDNASTSTSESPTTTTHFPTAIINSNNKKGEIELKDVWFKYPNQSDWALKAVNLKIPAGRTLALAGYSGGGKTTIAMLVLGLYPIQRGEITIDGIPITPTTAPALRNSIGAVLQPATLLSGTVADEVKLGKLDATDEEVIAALQAAQAMEFVRALPQGINAPVGERGTFLSGGQRQRIAIARALVRRPSVLILDEATSALDSQSESLVDKAIKQILGRTKLVIAHRLKTVKAADEIAVVDGGQIAELGSHDVLMQKVGGIYRGLVETSELGSKKKGSSNGSNSSMMTHDDGDDDVRIQDGSHDGDDGDGDGEREEETKGGNIPMCIK